MTGVESRYFLRTNGHPRLQQYDQLYLPGTTPSISADGPRNGIVWAIEHSDPQDVLHAYDATDLTKKLYNSNQASRGRDHFGVASHFGAPMIANGMVFVGTADNVTVFGLLGQ